MKWLKRTAIVLYYLALFVALVTWLSVALPLAFKADFSVTNRTNTTLSITPVGTVGIEGHRTLLPLYRTSFPWFVKSKRGNFELAANETFRFSYDMDDINFSEIVIENISGESRQIVANPNPTQHQYVVPVKTEFIIDAFDALSTVPPNVKKAATEGRKSGKMWLAYTIFATLLITECLRMGVTRRKKRSNIAFGK